jgi:hypothetical protein
MAIGAQNIYKGTTFNYSSYHTLGVVNPVIVDQSAAWLSPSRFGLV